MKTFVTFPPSFHLKQNFQSSVHFVGRSGKDQTNFNQSAKVRPVSSNLQSLHPPNFGSEVKKVELSSYSESIQFQIASRTPSSLQDKISFTLDGLHGTRIAIVFTFHYVFHFLRSFLVPCLICFEKLLLLLIVYCLDDSPLFPINTFIK